MCEEELEEKLLALIKTIPYNKIKCERTMCSKDIYTYKNFKFEVIHSDYGFRYYYINNKGIDDNFGSEIQEILEEKLLNSDKDEYFNFLQNIIEELKK